MGIYSIRLNGYKNVLFRRLILFLLGHLLVCHFLIWNAETHLLVCHFLILASGARCMGNEIVKVCAKCGKPTKKQFRNVCKFCGHDRWAPPTAHEQLVLAYAKSSPEVASRRSHVHPAEQFSDPVVAYSKSSHDVAYDSSDSEYDEISAAVSSRKITGDSAAAAISTDVVRQTPQLDLTQLGISSAFLTANAEEAIKSPRPFGRPDASRSDTTSSSECTRVRVGPRRATRNLREMQMILRQESPGRSGTMPSESRSNKNLNSSHEHASRSDGNRNSDHSSYESKIQNSEEKREGRQKHDPMIK